MWYHSQSLQREQMGADGSIIAHILSPIDKNQYCSHIAKRVSIFRDIRTPSGMVRYSRGSSSKTPADM